MRHNRSQEFIHNQNEQAILNISELIVVFVIMKQKNIRWLSFRIPERPHRPGCIRMCNVEPSSINLFISNSTETDSTALNKIKGRHKSKNPFCLPIRSSFTFSVSAFIDSGQPSEWPAAAANRSDEIFDVPKWVLHAKVFPLFFFIFFFAFGLWDISFCLVADHLTRDSNCVCWFDIQFRLE